MLRLRLRVAVIDEEDLATAGRLPGTDIPPAVANHVAVFERDAEVTSRLDQQARLRLPAGAALDIGMETRLHRVEGELAKQAIVHGFDQFASLPAAPDIGLVGNHDVEKTG